MKIFLCLIALGALITPFNISAKSLKPHVNSDNKTSYPKRFRTSNDKYSAKISRDGLNKLQASASGQFSENNLRYFLSKLTNKNVTVVDLRKEYHGFVNGCIICWKPYENNHSVPEHQIKEKEDTLLKNILKNPNNNLIPGVKLESVLSERELVEKLGLKYVRIPITDHQFPNDAQIDYLITFIKTRPSNTWLHFHCAGGAGRATTLMCMLDMMYNPQLSPDVIMRRQSALGGSNILGSKKAHDKKRRDFFTRFHNYCAANPGFNVTWSAWVKMPK